MKVAVEDLFKSFGRAQVLERISFELTPGLYGLLGPNGAGKTTLLRIMATVMLPSEGRVLYNGLDNRVNAMEVRGLMGYLPQGFGAGRSIAVSDFLDYVGALKGLVTHTAREETRRVLGVVNLLDKARSRIGALSGGMLQRLGVAQALVGDPDVLLLDEPTAGLDPEERMRLLNTLAELSLNKVVVLSTHIVSDVDSCCSSVLVLKQGRLVFSGEPREVASVAAGRIWSVEVGLDEYNVFSRSLDVLSVRRNASTATLLVLSDVRPENAKPEPPTVEWGYRCLLKDPSNLVSMLK